MSALYILPVTMLIYFFIKKQKLSLLIGLIGFCLFSYAMYNDYSIKEKQFEKKFETEPKYPDSDMR